MSGDRHPTRSCAAEHAPDEAPERKIHPVWAHWKSRPRGYTVIMSMGARLRGGGEFHDDNGGHTVPPRAFSSMSPAAFGPMNGLPGVAALARDEHWHLLWCNEFYATLCESTREAMLGTTMSEFLPAALAHEREEQMRPALEEGQMVAYYQLWHGSRWYTRVWPLDPAAFGERGVFVVIQSIAQDESVHHHDLEHEIAVLTTGHFAELDALSPRELEVFYHVACGLTSAEIASLLFRSVRTIEQHANQIYRKLGMTSRAQLTKFAVERGIVAFSSDQWQTIVQNRSDN
jgi:DNA-binding CsgD family transcriptional regulator